MPPHVSTTNTMQLLGAYGLADLDKGKLLPSPLNVVAKTASYTILPTDRCGTLFTNRAAAGAVTFTLPAPAAVPAGTWYYFVGVVAQNLIVATATADTMVTLNDIAADTIAIQTANQIIGAAIKMVCDGTQWIALGETVGATYTVVTA